MFSEISKDSKFIELEQALQKNDSVLIEGLWNAPKALIATLAIQATGKHVLILTGANREENQLYNDFAYFGDTPVIDFPAWETLPTEKVAPSPDVVGDRYKALETVLSSSRPHIVIGTLQACLQRLIPPSHFKKLYLKLKVGDSMPFELLVEELTKLGYERRPVASDKGEFALRGGIVDIFPVSSPDPYRLEFYGDEIDSMRIYDPIGQRSMRTVQDIEITPAQELELLDSNAKLGTLLDYLGPNTLVILDDLLALEDRYASLMQMLGKPSPAFIPIEQFLEDLEKYTKIYLSPKPIEELSEVQFLDKAKPKFYSTTAPMHSIGFQMFNRDLKAQRWKHPFQTIVDFFQPEGEALSGDELMLALPLASQDCRLHFLCASEAEQNNFQLRLQEAKVALPVLSVFEKGYLSGGFAIPESELVILPLTEFTHRYHIRRPKQRSTYHTLPTEVYDLSPGEMIVHFSHGIGRYLGMEMKPNHQGHPSEFFVIEYAESSKLFVPINQAYLISKYIGSTEEQPRLHTLGSGRWKKTRDQTEAHIKEYAKDLLKLYAQRAITPGHVYSEDSEDMIAFENDFPYEETEDQLQAIAAIKQDMCSTKVMDRLICGDVGYGKTEVAMRAAFKAVLDGKKQVAVLVPTTVLALQHYETFLDRMNNFPINVAVISRMRTAKEIREILKRVEEGSIDILIGTHRIISGDVKFKDLGLIIIDEEQRFGVKAKEHLKKIKHSVDCLTLSATPIPRTLYMSLVGARDMSIINTPPQDRLPIKTIIAERDDQILKNALLRELNRDGQVFVIHNRVETIYEMASHIKKLLPQVRIVVAHGQMDAEESSNVFHAFKNGEADVLVATAIIENGIDIPNANTILIDRADRFGLSSLYQFRGRVGRWVRRAYAYFLVPNMRILSELSRKRLYALAELSGYGGGMKLSMRDLELRGAGDILGIEQSGHVTAIGFHFYCKMLKRAMLELEGKAQISIYDTKVEIPAEARLTDDYINDPNLRMEIYHRLGEAISWEEVDAIWAELKDRFGTPPITAQWLHHLTKVRVYGANHGFTLIKMDNVSVTAEIKKGEKLITKQFILSKPKTPQEMETKLITALRQEFALAS